MLKNHKNPKNVRWDYGIMDGHVPFIIANGVIDFDELPENCSAYYAKEGSDTVPYIQLCSEYNEGLTLTVVMFRHEYGYCKEDSKEYHRYSITPVQKKYKEALKWLGEDIIRNYKRNLFEFLLKHFPIIKSSTIDVDITASIPSIYEDIEYVIRVESIKGKIDGNPIMEMVHISIKLRHIYGGKIEDELLWWDAVIYCDINTAKLNMVNTSISCKLDSAIDIIINDIMEDFDVYIENDEAIRNEVYLYYMATQFETVKRIIPIRKIGE